MAWFKTDRHHVALHAALHIEKYATVDEYFYNVLHREAIQQDRNGIDTPIIVIYFPDKVPAVLLFGEQAEACWVLSGRSNK